ncbi:metal/formaldehyde-sensitive transcriptional repressor [Paludibacterium paludis]|uniref:Metal/formaldehyde-sensitive transcriptional repressor n=1 Tax=Paludibacterium paludis TaxID=1225769 RepID=A0A918P1C5_9NEIS|nr:metal/formaldehyde-sensitive transcriptional repressor [Paludibacterium paludis]GGY11945.1 hypothetical protein GCM10011289_13620 [Paludibacterium paludis]
MTHTTRDKQALLTRVRRIRGQVEALENALRDDAGCMAILQQVAAVRGAANGLLVRMLEDHLREHLGPDADDGARRRADVEDVAILLRRYLK